MNGPDHTLQATALVHEAYLRLVDGERVQDWESRGHFFGAAAEAMRRILVDAANRKGTLKRGGDHRKIQLTDADLHVLPLSDDVLALNEALEELAKRQPTTAELVKLRYFAGLTNVDAAKSLVFRRVKPMGSGPMHVSGCTSEFTATSVKLRISQLFSRKSKETVRKVRAVPALNHGVQLAGRSS